MEILIEVTEEHKTSKLSMKGASHDNERAIISGFFNLFVDGREKSNVTEIKPKISMSGQTEKSPESSIVAKELVASVKDLITKPTIEPKTAEQDKQVRPRQLPLIGAEKRMTAKLGELANIKIEDRQDVQEHWKTGIKIDEDGTKRYRCHYRCSCGGRGKRYIPLDIKTITCRECEKELQVYTATLEMNHGIPGRDDFGNYFLARDN